MAEATPLLSSNSSGQNLLSSRYRSRYKNVCIQSKGALLVLVISILMANITIIFGPLFAQLIGRYSFLLFAAIGLYYLFYPILGLLGEKWMRYKVMIIGMALLCVGLVIITVSLVSLYFLQLDSITTAIVLTILSCPFLLGYGLFQANVIQFGTDQLLFSPSEELSSYIYWFLYMYYCPLAVVLVMSSIVNGSVHNNTIYVYVFTVIFGSGYFFICFALLSLCCFKHHLVFELAQHNNPVKLIWRVIKYAWKHKQPVRRSAFTFGESPPSRLDLAKERYGGPFTTVQVEDVKSFLYILSILLGILAFGLVDTESKLLDQYLQVVRLKNDTYYNVMESVLLIYPLAIPYCVIVFAVPLYQFVIIPSFRFIPSMLKRIWIGLVALLVVSVMTTVISYMINHDFENVSINNDICLSFTDNITFGNGLQSDEVTLPFYVMAVPQFFVGISIFLVRFTTFEFILAQGPRTMQGLLIGIWYINNSIYCVHLTLASSQYGCYWEYYAVKTGVVFISVIIYSIAAYKYKYRQRNELSDVNERVIITEYTERQLEQKYGIEDEENDHNVDDNIHDYN